MHAVIPHFLHAIQEIDGSIFKKNQACDSFCFVKNKIIIYQTPINLVLFPT